MSAISALSRGSPPAQPTFPLRQTKHCETLFLKIYRHSIFPPSESFITTIDQSDPLVFTFDQSEAVILPIVIDQVEEEDRKLESLSFGERIKLVDQMRREVNREQNDKINAMILESGYEL